MTHEERWSRYIEALNAYVEENGHARVPVGHNQPLPQYETTVTLGLWVSYNRQRYRTGRLSVEKANQLASVPGWEWGPLRPGPRSDETRNTEIISMRSQGISLQKIGDTFGLSRQRIHQIVNLESGKATL
jgi:hypothetical protein